MGAVALLAVIGVTVAVTLSVAGGGSGGNPPTTSPTTGNGPDSPIASANDKGPATIITEDPTCAPVRPILETRAGQQRNGWDTRDPSIPASAWTPAQRAQYEAVGQSMRSSADQVVALVKLTPHRVMRELYEQLIAYSRAYADRIPTYKPPDDNLALVSIAAAGAISNICAALSYDSASARGPLVATPEAPSEVASTSDPAEPQRFLTDPNSVCPDWIAALSQFQNDTAAWLAIPSDIPASQWNPEQRAVNDAVAPVMSASADKLQALGARSGNPTLEDFAVLSAQYRRAYVLSLPSYIPADNYLANSALLLSGVVKAACQAAEE
ncbi:MAG TPA: hypothetical protein VJ777_03245 [Mycobacterium sp.]|nr:hypothetical protein [Mycobacterium sp.]